MKYMLLICGRPDATETPETPSIESWLDYVEGKRLHGSRMRPITDATTVRSREGEVLVSDGPFAETTEHVGGYDLIEVDNLDEAIDIASRHPVAHFGSIEIRPLWEG
ncbi:MAG TPA: YciI family protein [Pseudonocardiaceae bacterium]|nr:YciI family protein [Pseudonocardiaceae bacterium]